MKLSLNSFIQYVVKKIYRYDINKIYKWFDCIKGQNSIIYYPYQEFLLSNRLASTCMTNQRRQEMKGIWKLIKAELSEFLKSTSYPYTVSSDILKIIDYRIRKPGYSSRGYFVVKAHEYITGEKNAEIGIKLGLLAELCTCITYLENQIVDEKNGVNSPRAKSVNLISSRFVWRLIKKYVANNFPQRTQELLDEIDEVLFCFSKGEALELYYLQYYSYQQKVPTQVSNASLETTEEGNFLDMQIVMDILPSILDLETLNKIQVGSYLEVFRRWISDPEVANCDYLNYYFHRTYLINTALYECMTKIMLKIHQKDSGGHNELISFARYFGFLQQLVNDVNDFVPTEWMRKKLQAEGKENLFKYKTRGRDLDDSFADLRNGLITLPLAFFLHTQGTPNSIVLQHLKGVKGKKGNVKDGETVKDKATSFKEEAHQETAIKEMLKTGCFLKAIDFTRFLAGEAKATLLTSNPAHVELTDMVSIAYKSAYYDYFVEIRNRI